MIPSPTPGFNASFETKVRQIAFRAEVDSHNFLSADSQDGYVLASNGNVYSASVSFATTTAVESVSVFLARESGTGQYVDVRILADSGGAPDTGTVIATSSIPVLGNRRPRFYAANLKASKYADSGLLADNGEVADAGSASLWVASAGVTYWVEIKPVLGTVVRWFKNSNKAGMKYALGTSVTSNQTLVFKTRSTVSANNVVQLNDLADFSVTLTQKVDVDSASMTLWNRSRKYSELQPLRWLFDQNAEVSFFVGNGTDEVKVASMLVSHYRAMTDRVEVGFVAKNSRGVLRRPLIKSTFIGADFSVAVKDLLSQAGIPYNNADIQSTGMNWPSTGTAEKTIMDTLVKIAEASNFYLRFSGTGMAFFEEKPDTFNPDYQLNSAKHILDRSIETKTSSEPIVNRAIMSNGATSDGNDLSFSAATVLQNFTGSIPLSSRSVTKAVQFTTPTFQIQIVDNVGNGAVAISELTRTSYGVSFLIINNQYPNETVTYDVSVVGHIVENTSTTLLAYEKARPNSINAYGVFDLSRENDLLSSLGQMQHALDDIVLFNSLPRKFLTVTTRGIPTLEVGDFVSIDHADINPQMLFKIRAVTLECVGSPRSFSAKYELESFPFYAGASLSDFQLYADNGLYSDAGLISDLEYQSDLLTY